ncbi:MAG: T9SS type A sorting domain-containing protein [Bacteroidetes bacterium]|nr:T9SS type A sorting domain-containing protein [Bacteroidota bacterium]
MKHFFNLFFVLLLTSTLILAQDVFQRTSEIPTLEYETGGGGFGGIVAGVDFDGDGLPEIYACNTNFIDRDGELVPRVYKFEWNESTSSWDNVWNATAPLELQNTWPAFTWGDLDKDGKPEIIWAPVNYSPYPELPRILVYEYQGDGSDNMGVGDGFGGFTPNASTPIVSGDGVNLRPIKFEVKDIDGDGTNELIFCDRNTDYHYGILSVDDIPDAGGGTETWTLEASGVNDATLASSGNKYDFSIIGSTIYLFNSNGDVYPVKESNGSWAASPALTGVGENYGSFKGSVTADLDGDGTDEIILGGWDSPTKVFVLKQVGDTLQTIDIGNSIDVVTLNGAAKGDLDNDGKWDFVFGTRGSPASVPNNAMLRVEFQGGDISSPANYITSIIDSMLVPEPDGAGGQIDVVAIGNIDGDSDDELVYTQGYTRGIANDTTANIAIVGLKHTPVSVELVEQNIPSEFYLDQNYPNPFNPSTTIKFGLTREMRVELKIYSVLGQEVMTLINKDIMTAGSYNVTFNASNLASGTYIYRLVAGDYAVSKKMQLIK